MELLLTGAFVFLCYKACKKRAKITHQCPRCGGTCHASPWSTGLQHQGGDYIHSFTCKNCGYKFMD